MDHGVKPEKIEPASEDSEEMPVQSAYWDCERHRRRFEIGGKIRRLQIGIVLALFEIEETDLRFAFLCRIGRGDDFSSWLNHEKLEITVAIATDIRLKIGNNAPVGDRCRGTV